jgi:hypothetical protein
MSLLDADEVLSLAQSHRFGKDIAELVEGFVHAVGSDGGFELRGNPDKVSVVQRAGKLVPGPSAAIIARTNCELLEKAAIVPASCHPVFAQDLKVVGTAWDVYHLSRGARSQIRDKLVGSFESIEELERYAGEVDDRKLRGMARMVKTHGKNMRPVLERLAAIPTWDPDEEDGAPPGLVLATVHSVKGLEFQVVQLCGDMFQKLGTAIRSNDGTREEEANMVYVAMTRAQEVLVLPDEAWGMQIDWPRLSPTAGTAAQAASQPQNHVDWPAPLPQMRLGARVRTPMGDGCIVLGGEMGQTVLVKLDKEENPVRLMSRLVRRV